MKIEFTEFHPLTDLVQVDVYGNLILGWDGNYIDAANNGKKYQQPSTGSGLRISPVKLFATEALPDDLQDQIKNATAENAGEGWIYILRSSKYNILYVGISGKSLATGVFGDGRFRHHLRKLLAAKGGATDHTGGWREHAKERYANLCKLAKSSSVTNSHALVSDLYISIAHVPDPKKFEKFVLNKCAATMTEPIILNLASNGLDDVKAEVVLPGNTLSVDEEKANFENFDLEECETYGEASAGIAEDYAEFTALMSENCRNDFHRLLDWARARLLRHDDTISEGLIGMLTNQPDGYGGMPLVGFSRRKKNGHAMPNGWFARIPLRCGADKPMTIILPLRLKPNDLPEHKIIRGQDSNFRPVDVDDFLKNSQAYIKL